jgi:hypothetical protein
LWKPDPTIILKTNTHSTLIFTMVANKPKIIQDFDHGINSCVGSSKAQGLTQINIIRIIKPIETL